MKRGRPRKTFSSVEVSEDNPISALPAADKKGPQKKMKKEDADSGRGSTVENETPSPEKQGSEASGSTTEVGSKPETMSRAELRTTKVKKLKELLSCIQSYAQFTSAQLAEQKKFAEKAAAAAANKTKKTKVDEAPVAAEMFTGQLRDYQQEGVRWLRMLHDLAINGILADEMGLGKTVMVIAAIAKIVQSGAPGPFLVIAPLSTLPNWDLEVKRFIPDIPMVLFHGDATKRKALRAEIDAFHKLPKKYAPATSVRPVVITSYEMVIAETSYLSRIDWRMLVVDEAQRLKNENCVLRNKLRKFTTPRRLILTGTPIQNSLTELWSLMNFLMPDIFNTRLSSFEALLDEILSDDSSLWVTDEADAKQKEEIVTLLHNILRPFILRRLKADVELTIPPKKEVVVRCPLSKKQQELYGKLIDYTIEKTNLSKRGQLDEDELNDSAKRDRQQTIFFGVNDEEEQALVGLEGTYEKVEITPNSEDSAGEGGAGDEEEEEEEEEKETEAEQSVDFWLESFGTRSLRNLMMQLRKCVNHPYLFRMSYLINEDFIKASGKLRILDCMLEQLLRNPKRSGHKCIIYSQFIMNLDILAQYCDYRGYRYVRIDGHANLIERTDAIREFNADPKVLIFLVSTRAGGLGINLTAADTVFIYDSDWNPQMDLQARDRCHRIGQTRPVVIYRFIVANTIDQRMFECATGKRRLERVVLHQSVFQHAADSLVNAASGEDNHEDKQNDARAQKFSFSIDDLLALLKLRDWEERDDSALNFDGPKGEIDSRIAELLDRSDLEEEWRQTCIKKAASDAISK